MNILAICSAPNLLHSPSIICSRWTMLERIRFHHSESVRRSTFSEPIDSSIEHTGNERNERNGGPEVGSKGSTTISTYYLSIPLPTPSTTSFTSTSTTTSSPTEKTTLTIVRNSESAKSTSSTTSNSSTTTASSTNSLNSDMDSRTADDIKTNTGIKAKHRQEVEGDSSIMDEVAEAVRTTDTVMEKKAKTIDTTDESNEDKKKIRKIDKQRVAPRDYDQDSQVMAAKSVQRVTEAIRMIQINGTPKQLVQLSVTLNSHIVYNAQCGAKALISRMIVHAPITAPELFLPNRFGGVVLKEIYRNSS
ncbi:hypothetical protein PRIPAC_95403 [Pristionchus pacificus]|uniref:Uncharacterized protein n=1 Tax=Pristionchus pacificus TaxID=54126 RepID=A0A2A6BJZ6_PRIPA|nr:hypothetical protein PRIPAC_95403 [Pristionchus pacificus]|eukprot:PDM66207.1 hypothetical protein PRIPAC_45432 [Pristionchus pacificus]